MLHDKKDIGYKVSIRVRPPASAASASESAPPKERVSLGDGLSAGDTFERYTGASAIGAGMAMGAVAGMGSLAGLAAGLSCVGAAGALAGMLGGPIGAALGKELGGVLSKNAKEVTNQQRTRRTDGRFRTKSGATHLDSLRETYGLNFAAGLPGNMPLQVLRASTGMSLTQMLKNPEAISEKKEELSAWEAPKPAPGGRTRNANGRIRQKRSDTKIDTLRDTYGMDFAAQLPGNWPLAILRESTGKSLSELVKSPDSILEAFPGTSTDTSNIDKK